MFWVFLKNGKVYAQIIPDASKEEIFPIIRQTVKSVADIYTDGWSSYHALAVYGYNHNKINHQKNEFARQDIYINEVDNSKVGQNEDWPSLTASQKALLEACVLESE